MAELTDVDQVRVLINDYHPDDVGAGVFTTVEIQTFLDLEGGSVKRAAAQACDVIADNEALVSKVIRTQTGLSTDGAKVADSLRKRAAALREQAATDDDADGYFEVVDFTSGLC